jgi:LemA protein
VIIVFGSAFAVLVLLAALLFISIYNGLVHKRNAVENAWAQVDVQLKRRHDLVPNLVEVVRGYAGHERPPARRPSARTPPPRWPAPRTR